MKSTNRLYVFIFSLYIKQITITCIHIKLPERLTLATGTSNFSNIWVDQSFIWSGIVMHSFCAVIRRTRVPVKWKLEMRGDTSFPLSPGPGSRSFMSVMYSRTRIIYKCICIQVFNDKLTQMFFFKSKSLLIWGFSTA